MALKEQELENIVNTEIQGTKDLSELEDQRETAMNYYLGEPFGNEIQGRSSIISTDVQEAIEWTKPSLMRIFASTNRIVEFEPFGPEDESGAKQETDLVNHVFFKENNGFLLLYTFISDGLLQKTGVIKYWWDESETVEEEEYEGLSDNELSVLLSDPDIEPLEHEEIIGEQVTHSIKIKRTNKSGRVMVECVAPEEFLVGNDTSSIDPQEARFVCHHTLKTRSELIALGIDKDIVDTAPPENQEFNEPEKRARDYLDQEFEPEGMSKETEKVRYNECYVRVDFDGDGIAELRQVVLVGKKLVSNEVVSQVPFAAWTPIIITHKFYGLSEADTVMDLQLIRSTLMRGILDNTYSANNNRLAVEDGEVNLDDLLTSRPDGIVRTQQSPSNVIMPLPHNPIPPQTFQTLEMTEKMRKERTGVGQDTMGLEANVLAHGRTGVVSQSFDMARMRIELIARICAETGIRQLFLGIHKLLLQHQEKPKWIKMRGEWVEVNPSEWKDRTNMSINVGLGSGNKDKQVEGIQLIMALQEKLLPTGQGVTPQNIFNALETAVELLGFRNVERFFTDPATQEPPPEEPDVQEQLAQAQIQLLAAQTETQRQEAITNRQEAQWKHEENMLKIANEDARERTKMELEFQRNIPGAVI